MYGLELFTSSPQLVNFLGEVSEGYIIGGFDALSVFAMLLLANLRFTYSQKIILRCVSCPWSYEKFQST